LHRKGSRCGIVPRARFGQRAPLLASLALLVLLVSALPAAGSRVPGAAAGSVTIVIHGQGRVTSEPAGAIDCPGRCSLTFAGATKLALRATPADGYANAGIGFCFEELEVCTVDLIDAAQTVDVYFRPRAKLQLWPNGDGAITVSPPPADYRGEPASASCAPGDAFAGTGCELYYLPGTRVTATASAAAPSTFAGWSAYGCAGTGACSITLGRDLSSLVARFSPLKVNISLAGNNTGRIASEPAGIACPPTCSASFPAGSQVTLIVSPDPATSFLSWKFGCSVSPTDPRRCTLTVTNNPNWVGVALGEDAEIGVPTTLAVLFDVAREGKGAVKSKELDCGGTCEHRYVFGAREELRATPAGGWRFTQWNGACGKAATCSLYIGPVTSVKATFTENLAPQLQSVKATGKKSGRKLTVRLSVRHAAQARLQLRRDGTTKLLADRRFALKRGANAVVLGVPAKAKAGRYRVTIAVSDGLGGGRTYVRVIKVGP
jgi:hypothetical protein